MGFFDWLNNDVLRYLYLRYLSIVNEEETRRKAGQVFLHLLDNIPLFSVIITALGAPIVAMPGIAAILPGIMTAVSGFFSGLASLGKLTYALSVIYAPITSALPALFSLIGLSATPIGWGLASIFALPIIAGGFAEAFVRIKESYMKLDSMAPTMTKLKGSLWMTFAFLMFPYNFLYGCGRTFWHLMTGRGYCGSVKETYESATKDARHAVTASDLGGGSIFKSAVPTIVDRALGAGIGAIVGFGTAFARSYHHGPFLIKIIPNIIEYTLMGAWRGLYSGSRAAKETFAAHSKETNNDVNLNKVGKERDDVSDQVALLPVEFDDIGRVKGYTTRIISKLSQKQGVIHDLNEFSNRYKAAEKAARLVEIMKKFKVAKGKAKELLKTKFEKTREEFAVAAGLKK